MLKNVLYTHIHSLTRPVPTGV